MEHIRTWQNGPYTLDLWDTYKRDGHGKVLLHYHFKHEALMIFEGSDFACSPMDAIDSDACVASLLGFLSLRPGDTDDEYFDGYTERQIAWRDEHAEDLSMIVHDIECDPVD